ncbi:MAG: MBL fold metallo-hydrolase [Clostridia bacterium]
MINDSKESKVILSASGMCEAGRIRHHLKHNLWREESTIVFVGYQVEGTLGRIILDGVREVKLFNEIVAVNARICQLKGTSSHADRSGLLEWASKFDPKPQKIFVTHGEDSVAEGFAQTLFDEQHQKAIAPYNGEQWELLSGKCVIEGNKVKIKTGANGEPYTKAMAKNPTYANLIAELKQLDLLVKSNDGLANSELRKMSKQIESLIKSFKQN